MIKAFPKIFQIGTDYIGDIFNEEVEITEKIDGSQLNFGKVNGQLYLRSKNAILYPEKPEKMFQEGINYISSISDRIPDNTVFYCEYLKNPKHNILKYERVPKNHLILFGISNFGTEKFDIYFDNWTDVLEIEAVPTIFQGKINTPGELIKMLETESILGGTKVEGIVIKNYSRPFLLGGQPIPIMAGKFVSEHFKETHREKWGLEYTTKGRWTTFLESFKTEARWQKAIQHLRERGELEDSPRDIGKLLKEINTDIEAEEVENIKNYLWKEYKRQIFSVATRGFPEWYKSQLLKRNFEMEEATSV